LARAYKLPHYITNDPPRFQEEFEYTKGVIRICKSKKNKQHNGQ